MQRAMKMLGLLMLFLLLLLQPSYQNCCGEKSCSTDECSSLDFENCARECCDTDEKYVVCYFTNWAWYRSEPVNFRPENINASLCTHILYAFSSLDTTSLKMVSSDSWADIDNKFFQLVTAFKEYGVKVLLSIGGWNNSGGTHWSKLINNATARAIFITEVVTFLKTYNFDGLDMDFEYPCCPQGNYTAVPSTDKDYFNVLLSELKAAFNGTYLLTAATAGGEKIMNECYNMKELCRIVDWINVMGYDYHSYSEGETGANAPLCGTGSTWGVYETIRHYVKVIKCPANKIVLGLPFYGKTYTLEDSSNPKFGVAVSGAGTAGTYTASSGTKAYYEICLDLISGYEYGFNSTNGSYAWSGDQFISYDSIIDIQRKSCLINKYFNLKGAMFWNLDYDDFNDLCGGGSYPLLKTINQQLRCYSPSESSDTCT